MSKPMGNPIGKPLNPAGSRPRPRTINRLAASQSWKQTVVGRRVWVEFSTIGYVLMRTVDAKMAFGKMLVRVAPVEGTEDMFTMFDDDSCDWTSKVFFDSEDGGTPNE